MSAEFEGVVGPDGKIVVPPAVLDLLAETREERLRVRLTGKRISGVLRRRGVTEEEITAICSVQREARDRVLSFLLSEGAMRRASRRVRAGRKQR